MAFTHKIRYIYGDKWRTTNWELACGCMTNKLGKEDNLTDDMSCVTCPDCIKAIPVTNTKEIKEGIKKDDRKPPMDLLSTPALVEISKVFGYGKEKYGKWNYRLGMDYSRIIAAAYRHLSAYNAGEDLDKESDLSHLAHLAACAIMLIDYRFYKLGKDDRWKLK